MDGTKNPYVKWNKSNQERQISHIFSHPWSLDLNAQVFGWDDGSADSAVDALLWESEFRFQSLYKLGVAEYICNPSTPTAR